MHRGKGGIIRTVLLILAFFLFLGVALQYGTKQYLIEDTFQQLEHNGDILADLAAAYYAEGNMSSMQLIINLDLASEFSGTDVLLCDDVGRILLCSDSPTGCFHQQYSLSHDFLQRIIDSEGIREICVLTNLYDGSRQVCATPVYSSATGQVVGVVLISTPISEVIQSTTRISNFYLAAIALIMVLICALTL